MTVVFLWGLQCRLASDHWLGAKFCFLHTHDQNPPKSPLGLQRVEAEVPGESVSCPRDSACPGSLWFTLAAGTVMSMRGPMLFRAAGVSSWGSLAPSEPLPHARTAGAHPTIAEPLYPGFPFYLRQPRGSAGPQASSAGARGLFHGLTPTCVWLVALVKPVHPDPSER